jgi:hypothetical protein
MRGAHRTGVGIFEMDEASCIAEREQFQPLIEWVDPQYKVRSASTVIEMPRVASAGRSGSNAMRDLIRTTPPKPLLTAKAAVAKAPTEQAKPQLPAWLSRISQRFVE